jgi:phosphoadenosine phosphosulfate reductase
MGFNLDFLLQKKEVSILLTYDSWTDSIEDFAVDDTYKGALNALKWAYDEYGEEVVYACSFGIEGIVLIDLISKVKPDAKIVFFRYGCSF